ncbi:calcium-binding protein [Granulosicoccus antarcticus]|uniref:Bifunctional hemolysin/adenylate cyclase n=1 Tax=Granulosicoccus antarcticus IMCC3135 TaxID=1192854 RepID=A0A2Z2NXH4_9GAMM|nr:calcium-binding protein [Granulosicoccus antarcticus]ASJ73530.1 Bifunctional hemolysin/adenylate cyclase [Granulosicoccus antarcticus IMCC3135]
MIIKKSTQPRTSLISQVCICTAMTLLLVGCSGSDSEHDGVELPTQEPPEGVPPGEEPPGQGVERVVLQGNDLNNIGSPLLSLNPDGPGGSPNQSLRSGDILQGGVADEVIIGALGVDVLLGGDGDDVLIGGTEDFNSSVDGDALGADNRDRAFGGNGDDIFIWTPGDGSDYFDGGPGTDVVAFGLLGEERDSDSGISGAPFFNVNAPGSVGSFDFDGIFLDQNTRLPTLSVSTSPGFCTVLDISTNPTELAMLSLDHLVRFGLRGVANAFDAGEREDDDGLRVSLSLRNVEYVVCTKREVADGGGVENIDVLDITTNPPTLVSLSDLPDFVQQQIQ